MKLKERLRRIPRYKIKGRITGVTGPIIEAFLPKVSIGDSCKLENGVEAEVVGFKDNKTLLMAYDDTKGISVGSWIESRQEPVSVGVGEELLGCVVDPFGKPLNKDNFQPSQQYYLKNEIVNPLERARITEPLDVGIRAINALLTIGKGQRIGIFSGAGVGKSTLLGMISRFTEADVNVITLIGERGREVREFIEDNLGEEGLRKSVVVVATSDQPPLAKIRAVYTAIAIANYFSNTGKDVLFLVDSLTRLAMAQREIGLAIGEPPTTKGYTPSVFALLPKFIEQAGNFVGRGSITGIYTVLVEGDDISMDPVADAAMGFLDGHIVLSRNLANKRIFPAIDILKSVSRLMPQLVDDEILKYQSIFMDMESTYRESEDMINLGLYKKGTTPKIDLAIDIHPEIEMFIKQDMNEKISFEESINALEQLAEKIKNKGLSYGINWS
ncbi:flagellum-specific ATP synthase [Persephonella hydrogeniphila]|uniref:Flagellum-specific ATP synthase n=1 Tax=Persephonella hydrogeniphila TaxID=198703 RepID=A0A285NFP6_9AQUI|nr:FliI/YscN family ATPase [Persephonella hydrogeniphila]SNZ08098.1 flagellum-specific ATP synthase [Persephonella hydrogeniphila]